MKCSKITIRSLYRDGRLADRERVEFESHLAECADCQAFLDAFGWIGSRLASSDRYPAPAGFHSGIAARIAAAEAYESRPIPAFLRLAEVVIVLLLVTAGVLSGRVLTKGQEGAGPLASLSLEVFEPAPPDSIGGAYLALTEADHAR